MQVLFSAPPSRIASKRPFCRYSRNKRTCCQVRAYVGHTFWAQGEDQHGRCLKDGVQTNVSIIRRKTGSRWGARVGNNRKSIHWSFIVEFLSGSFVLGLVSNQLTFVGVEAELLEGGGHSSRPWQQSELVLPNGGVLQWSRSRVGTH